MEKVFISHSSLDKDVVRKLSNDLMDYGIDVWLDEWEMQAGDSLIEKIQQGLEDCTYVLAIISKNSINSNWVKVELEAALTVEINTGKVIIIPVLIEDGLDLPLLLKSRIYLSIAHDYQAALDSLVTKINKIDIKPNLPTAPMQIVPYDIIDHHWHAELIDDHGNHNELIITRKLSARNATVTEITLDELTAVGGGLSFDGCNLTNNTKLKNVGGAYQAVATLDRPLIKGQETVVEFYFTLNGIFSNNPCTFAQRIDDPIKNGLEISISMPLSSPAVVSSIRAYQKVHKRDLDCSHLLTNSSDGRNIKLVKNVPDHGTRYVIEWERVFP